MSDLQWFPQKGKSLPGVRDLFDKQVSAWRLGPPAISISRYLISNVWFKPARKYHDECVEYGDVFPRPTRRGISYTTGYNLRTITNSMKMLLTDGWIRGEGLGGPSNPMCLSLLPMIYILERDSKTGPDFGKRFQFCADAPIYSFTDTTDAATRQLSLEGVA